MSCRLVTLQCFVGAQVLFFGHRARAAEAAEVGAGGPPAHRGDVVPQCGANCGGSAPRRRLTLLDVVSNWQWPADTNIKLTTFEGAVEEGTTEVRVCASVIFTGMDIQLTGFDFGGGHINNTAGFKLVSADTAPGDCYKTAHDVPVGDNAWMGIDRRPLEMSYSGNRQWVRSRSIIFMMGGSYKLCYTPDGIFGGGDNSDNMLPATITVYGVVSPCTSDGCLKNERWDCSFGYKGESIRNCIFSFVGDASRGRYQAGWDINNGTHSRMTWGQTWSDNVGPGGSLETTSSRPCAQSSPDMNKFTVEDNIQNPQFLVLSTQTQARLYAVSSDTQNAFTLSACYCPNYNDATGRYCSPSEQDCCNQYTEFIQQFGIIYYWTLQLCDYQPDGVGYWCPPYMRVVPQQKFVLRIECPPGGGCTGNQENRIKFLDETSSWYDRPSWNTGNGCISRHAEAEPAAAVWPGSQDSRQVHGGNRVDYKIWRTKQVKLDMGLDERLDLCYCNGQCSNNANWFRVGEVRTTSSFAIASKLSASSSVSTIKYAQHQGSFSFFGGIWTNWGDTVANPYDSNKYSGTALVNFISWDQEAVFGGGRLTFEQLNNFDREDPDARRNLLNSECRKEEWWPQLAVAPGQPDGKSYMPNVNPQTDNVADYLEFEQVTIQKAGVVAVCYCARVTDVNECESLQYWYYAGRMTIRGPRAGQVWNLPTQIVVKVAMEGWGFSSDDKLRIVAHDGSCSGDPSGVTVFKVDCPGTNCQSAAADQKIQTHVTTANSAALTIRAVEVGRTSSSLWFYGSTQNILEEDDVITIDFDRVRVGVHVANGHSIPAYERYQAYKLSGEYEHQDALSDSNNMYMTGHRVKRVVTNNVVDYERLSIPVGWDVDPNFEFESSHGYWTRRNKLETNEELKGKVHSDQALKVCWGVRNSLTTQFYSQAGDLRFYDPPPMASASVSLTTTQDNAIAPVVITFQTGADTTSYSTGSTGRTMLMIRFLDISDADGKLVPHKTGDSPAAGTGTDPFTADDYVSLANIEQQICGRLFVELWSDHSEGFPLPEGCYYSQKYRDVPEEGVPKSYREFNLVFGRGNGLRQNQTYQVVMNGKISGVSTSDNLVDVYAMCAEEAGCSSPYLVFEKGIANASKATEQAASERGEAQLHADDGVVLQRVTDEILDVGSERIIEVQLRAAGIGPLSIKPQALVRLYLWPLTMWDIGAGCVATCIKDQQSNQRCEGAVECTPEPLVATRATENSIKLRLPSSTSMDDITDTITPNVMITSFALPARGFFPIRMGAQLTSSDDTLPDYKTSTGFMYKAPDIGETTGKIVLNGRNGYGPHPFMGDPENVLYVRVQLGATVWNVGNTRGVSFIVINLPNEYRCLMRTHDGLPEDNLHIFGVDDDGDGYPDNNKGILSVTSSDGTWENSMSESRYCEYEVFPGNAIYAGMVVFMKLYVRNPTGLMTKLNEDNVFEVKLSSRGHQSRVDKDMDPVSFIPLGQETQYFGGNAAVIDRLLNENIQPADFSLGASQYIRVFFQTTQPVGSNGYIIVDAPDGFEFGASCVPADLPSSYYAFIGVDDERLRLREVKYAANGCTGMKYPATASTYNRARVHVTGSILRDLYYGFRIRVTQPTTYDAAHHSDWRIWTEDVNGYSIQGSYSTVNFNRQQATHRSWGMYEPADQSITVQVASMRPQSVTGATTFVTIYPIEFEQTTDTSFRVTAPHGFEWVISSASDFLRTTQGTEVDFPGLPDYPAVQNANQLVWPVIKFIGRTRYGFEAKISIPDHNPVSSSNSFFLEFGYLGTTTGALTEENRFMALVREAPPVHSLINCEVGYASNLVGYADNHIEFTIQTITRLETNSGILIKGDQHTRDFIFTCPHTMLPGSDPFPSDLRCLYQVFQDNTPLIMLKADENPIEPGLYKFELHVVNPSTRILTAGQWMFGTYFDVSAYPNAVVVDRALIAQGFLVNNQMSDAKLTDLRASEMAATGRNDRPGEQNELVFQFRLRYNPGEEADMILQGPRGFEFDEDCLDGIKTDSNMVFGPNTAGLWPPTLSLWNAECAPKACSGNDHIALITIPWVENMCLSRNNMYAFRITVKANPMVTPSWNKWSIDYSEETSEPFEGFVIWTLTHMTITPVSYAISDTVDPTENPVTITFQPYNTIRVNGLLRVTAPPEFEFVADDDMGCEVTLATTLAVRTQTSGANVFTVDDIRCEVQFPLDKKYLLVYLLTEDKPLQADIEYTLIARVFNPTRSSDVPATWLVDSFTGTASESTELDKSQITGYPINNVLNAFTVRNLDDFITRYNGRATVNDVDFLLQFPDPLKDDDEINIYGPEGFNLEGNPELQNCNDFRYASVEIQLEGTGEPSCTCVEQVCRMQFLINEQQDPALVQNGIINFKIRTENPPRTPFISDNYWKVEHKRGTIIKSSHIYPSWEVNPQLESVGIALESGNMAAETIANIILTFTPVSDADTIMIEALEPSEFDFGRSTVRTPFYKDAQSEGGIIIINRVGLVAGRLKEIRISSVRLGRGGGQTKFNLRTYLTRNRRLKMDEKVNFTGGFRLPGRITVESAELKSQYSEARTEFPVKSLLPPRVNEDATAEFHLQFSQPVSASQRLMILCQGVGAYTLRTTPFVIIGIGQVDATVEKDDDSGALIATLKPGRPATEVALEADRRYTVIVRVFPQPGTNTWRFDTLDGQEYPTNTNDGTFEGFNPIERMQLTVQAPRSPPRAIIDVVLNIDPGSAIVGELVIIAPPGFTFDERAAGCGDMCMPSAMEAGRRTAIIASPDGDPLTNLQGLRIRVQTPQQTPDSSITWFVVGRGQGASQRTGWGEGAGFRVTQMAGSTVSYAGVANGRGFLLAFTFTLDVDFGDKIQVIAPVGYVLSCSMEGALRPISLPPKGNRPSCIDEPLEIRLQTTLRAQAYAFALQGDLPTETPPDNTFSLIILDQNSNVVDAAYGIQGRPIVSSLLASNPTLAWSQSTGGQPTMITVGLTFNQDTTNIKALLITLPETFIHDVQKPTDVQNLNRQFPVASGSEWADTTERDKIKIRLDASADHTTIPANQYRWNFPALVPNEIPANNVWFLSLCDDIACSNPGHSNVVVSFPLVGFELDERAPAALMGLTAFAGRARLAVSVCMVLALFVPHAIRAGGEP